MSPFNEKEIDTGSTEWWQISDFGLDIGGIKQMWEGSWFDWVIKLVQQSSLGNSLCLERLEFWLQDWTHKNRPYQRVN